MGTCCSKSNKSSNPLRQFPKRPIPESKLYSPRVNTATVLRYDIAQRDFHESEVKDIPNFQEGQLTAVVGGGLVLCVGGVVDGTAAVLVDEVTLMGRKVATPPMPIAYGRMHVNFPDTYVIGALDLSKDNQSGDICPPLRYSLKNNAWAVLPMPPVPVTLCGSVLVEGVIYTFGGYLDHPNDHVFCGDVLKFKVRTEEWEKMSVSSPIQTSMSMCVVLPDDSILIIGGYDPSDHLPEAKEVLLFKDNIFEVKESLPGIGKLRFNDSPAWYLDTLYLFSEDETLFKYKFIDDHWDYVDLSGSVVTYETERLSILSQPRECVYHFKRDTCEFVEFSPKKNKFRNVAPTSFRHFVKHPGLLISNTGGIIVAGGIKLVSQDREESTDQVWMCDPFTKVALDLSPLPCAQSCLRMIQVQGDIYAMAGVSEGEIDLETHSQVLKEATGVWEPLSPMPYLTRFPAVAQFRGSVFCIAGECQTESEVQYNLIQVYHIPRAKWELLRTEYPFGLCHLGACSLDSGILCFGGVFADGQPSSACYLYNGETFSQRPSLKLPEHTKTASYFQDPSVLLEGKVFTFTKAGVLHTYDLAEDSWSIVT